MRADARKAPLREVIAVPEMHYGLRRELLSCGHWGNDLHPAHMVKRGNDVAVGCVTKPHAKREGVMAMAKTILDQVPEPVRRRLAWAHLHIVAWNGAITGARLMEQTAHQPGRYEHDLRYTAAGEGKRLLLSQSLDLLGWFEAECRKKGLDAQAVYAAIGGMPTPEPEAEAVAQWKRES